MGRLLLSASLIAGLLGCASTPPPQPARDAAALEGESPDEAAAPRTEAEDELASAWNREQKKRSKKDVKPPPPVADPREPFRQALSAARRAAGTPEAATTLAEAKQLAASLGPEERQAVAALALEQARAQEDEQVLAEAIVDTLRACGPDRPNPCRRGAISALTQLAKRKDAPKPLVTRAKALNDAETCLAKAEKTKRNEACLGQADRAFAKEKDAHGRARIALVRAEAEKQPAKKLSSLERVAKGCRDAVCANVRRRALKALSADARSQGDTEKAARYALEDQAVVLTTLAEADKAWGRTKEWDSACRAYEAKAGAGACRAMEQRVLGRYVFTDFSKQTAGDGLDGEVVRTVNAHYEPLLQPCLTEEARRLVPPDAVEYLVSWTVFNDGRVGEVHLRRDLDDSPLARCLKGSFDDWRYPRYQGEWQHVEQKFTVRANTRMGAR